jgi:hypothetical protein
MRQRRELSIQVSAPSRGGSRHLPRCNSVVAAEATCGRRVPALFPYQPGNREPLPYPIPGAELPRIPAPGVAYKVQPKLMLRATLNGRGSELFR